MKNNTILILGVALIAFGLFGKNLNIDVVSPVNPALESYVIDPPSDDNLLEEAKKITAILKKSSDSTRKTDCLKLSSLYSDISTLIELDNEDKVITDTASIRLANSLSGKMLRLNIKNKYPGLAEASESLMEIGIGKDDVVLDDTLRDKGSESFRALSWAFYEGSK